MISLEVRGSTTDALPQLFDCWGLSSHPSLRARLAVCMDVLQLCDSCCEVANSVESVRTQLLSPS